jgi:ferrochelatase
MKDILLLINTGSPDHHDQKSVKRYLRQFLCDKRVIQMPAVFRFLLVNLIIVPFRASKSSKLFRRVWSEEGSPLKSHTSKLVGIINDRSNRYHAVYGAMRYGNPSIESVMSIIREQAPDRLTVMPLYPHYTAATTGSAIAEVKRWLGRWNHQPQLKLITEFYNHPSFIKLFAERIGSHNPLSYDYIIFSYHGLPVRNIRNDAKELKEFKIPLNYTDSCHETTRLLAERLNLEPGTYSSSFQSRMSSRWLTPFTDDLITSLAQRGLKRILVIAPSFVADCLETIVEIEQDYKLHFISHGGKELTMVHSLNHSPQWADAVVEIASNKQINPKDTVKQKYKETESDRIINI